MRLKPSLLNIIAALFMVFCLVYTLGNYRQLAEGEGWGVVAMVGLAGVSIGAVVVDLILQQFIINRTILNIVEFFIVVAAVAFIYFR